MIDLDGGARLRRATIADLEQLLAIKRALPMPSTDTHSRVSPPPPSLASLAPAEPCRPGDTRSGGFLLGSDADTYAQLLAVARVWLLERGDEPLGFTVTLDDAVLRASPVWARRAQIDWQGGFEPEAALALRIAYFDQLAVLPSVRARYWGAALALRALSELIDEQQHALVLTTTVVEPIVNRAALPYLARVGAREVGRIDEHYPEVGRVVSAIHLIEAARYREHIARQHAAGLPATLRVIDAAQAEHHGHA